MIIQCLGPKSPKSQDSPDKTCPRHTPPRCTSHSKPIAQLSNDMRREEIRRQRIESEQRRRDELRDGYRRLKDALPVSNQKSSKVSLLDRGMYASWIGRDRR